MWFLEDQRKEADDDERVSEWDKRMETNWVNGCGLDL